MIWIAALYLAIGLLLATVSAGAYQKFKGGEPFDNPGRVAYVVTVIAWPWVVWMIIRAATTEDKS